MHRSKEMGYSHVVLAGIGGRPTATGVNTEVFTDGVD